MNEQTQGMKNNVSEPHQLDVMIRSVTPVMLIISLLMVWLAFFYTPTVDDTNLVQVIQDFQGPAAKIIAVVATLMSLFYLVVFSRTAMNKLWAGVSAGVVGSALVLVSSVYLGGMAFLVALFMGIIPVTVLLFKYCSKKSAE